MAHKAWKELGGSEYRRVFRENVPYDFLGDTMRLLINTYKATWESLERRYPFNEAYGEAHDLFPQELKREFDYKWRKLAKRYKGIAGVSLPNSNGGAYRTEIIAGRVVLNALAVESPKAMKRFREGRYRQVLAETCQLNIFETAEQSKNYERIRNDGPIYAVLLHGPTQSRSPGFINIGFPKKDSKGYEDNISLFGYYPEMLKLNEAPIEQEQEIALRLKPSAERKNKKQKPS